MIYGVMRKAQGANDQISNLNLIHFNASNSVISMHTGYAGCAITAGIPVKFGTAHGRLRPEVGSTKCIGACGKKGVPQVSRIFGTNKTKLFLAYYV